MNAVLEKEVDAVVRAGLYRTREDAVGEAANLLLAERHGVRVEAAIELSREGEVSLSRATEMAGTDFLTSRKLLSGVE